MRGRSGSNTTSGVDWVRAVAVSVGSDEAWFSAVKRQHVACSGVAVRRRAEVRWLDEMVA
jgi:hypothetical protein